jgi:hypothetical protein
VKYHYNPHISEEETEAWGALSATSKVVYQVSV